MTGRTIYVYATSIAHTLQRPLSGGPREIRELF